MKRKEYCYKAEINPAYILYIGYVFGKYAIFATDHFHTQNYAVYGPYKNIGTAENRLLKSANSYKSNPTKLYYMRKELLHEIGPFPAEKPQEQKKTA